MPQNHCNLCGHNWKGPMTISCPKCDGEEWYEGESCGLDGGTCDLCGCQFTSLVGQAHYCPNCGSKRWDHKATDERRRLDDTHPWVMEKVKTTKKGSKTYRYWMASWREGDKVKNIHIGSCEKMGEEAAREKARRLKAEAMERAHDIQSRQPIKR